MSELSKQQIEKNDKDHVFTVEFKDIDLELQSSEYSVIECEQILTKSEAVMESNLEAARKSIAAMCKNSGKVQNEKATRVSVINPPKENDNE